MAGYLGARMKVSRCRAAEPDTLGERARPPDVPGAPPTILPTSPQALRLNDSPRPFALRGRAPCRNGTRGPDRSAWLQRSEVRERPGAARTPAPPVCPRRTRG